MAAVALAQIHADAKRRRERTIKQIGTLHARVQQDVDEGVLLRLGHAGRDAHDDARSGEQALGQHTVQEEAEHGVRQLKIRDGALLQRANRHDIAGRAADHALGIVPDGQHLLGGALNGDYRRSAEHKPLALLVNQYIGGSKVNAQIVQLRHRILSISRHVFRCRTHHYTIKNGKRKQVFSGGWLFSGAGT